MATIKLTHLKKIKMGCFFWGGHKRNVVEIRVQELPMQIAGNKGGKP